MRYSEHYKLWLPENSDNVDVTYAAENFVIIDEKMKAIEDGLEGKIESSDLNEFRVEIEGEIEDATKELENKVDKVSGKGLSTNDFTTTEKNKLSAIETGANNYTHPAHTARSSGLYKVTVDSSGHVVAVSAVAKSDITALGIPSTNTTYSVATTSSNGLMSASDKVKVNNMPKVEKGSYNGTSNASNKYAKTLTFSFEPKILIVRIVAATQYTPTYSEFMVMQGETVSYIPTATNQTNGGVYVGTMHFTWDSKTVTFTFYEGVNYSEAFNTSGITYNYLALG